MGTSWEPTEKVTLKYKIPLARGSNPESEFYMGDFYLSHKLK